MRLIDRAVLVVGLESSDRRRYKAVDDYGEPLYDDGGADRDG
jgi:hypothetical protein